MAVALDLVGQKFGRLTVLKRVIKHDGKKKRTFWFCLCECGTEKVVSSDLLKSGKAKSCGCFSQEERIRRATKHGYYGTPAYDIWRSMVYRCKEGSKHQSTKYYNERGIKVCDRWQDFKNFHEDMGDPPEGLYLERIDSTLDYGPSNCRWATPKEQANNLSTNRMLTYNGKTQTAAQWADELGINKTTLYVRLFKGWSVEDALTKPLRKGRER